MQTACRLQEHAAGLGKKSWTRLLFTSCEQDILGFSCEKVRRKADIYAGSRVKWRKGAPLSVSKC